MGSHSLQAIRLSALFALLLSAAVCFGQGPTKQYLGTPSSEVIARGLLRADSAFGIPLDTIMRATWTKTKPHLSGKGDSLYMWSIAQQKWILIQGGGGGTAAWGNITGTLSAQTDLATALAAKQNLITTGTTTQYLAGDLSLRNFAADVLTVGSATWAPFSHTHTSAQVTDFQTAARAAFTAGTDISIINGIISYTGGGGGGTYTLSNSFVLTNGILLRLAPIPADSITGSKTHTFISDFDSYSHGLFTASAPLYYSGSGNFYADTSFFGLGTRRTIKRIVDSVEASLTWQAALLNGSTFSQGNVVAMGNNFLTFNNGSGFNINSTSIILNAPAAASYPYSNLTLGSASSRFESFYASGVSARMVTFGGSGSLPYLEMVSVNGGSGNSSIYIYSNRLEFGGYNGAIKVNSLAARDMTAADKIVMRDTVTGYLYQIPQSTFATQSWVLAQGFGGGNSFQNMYLQNIIKTGYDTLAHWRNDSVAAFKGIQVQVDGHIDLITQISDTTIDYSFSLGDITGYISQGTNVTITGSGTISSPYVISAAGGGTGYIWNHSTGILQAGSKFNVSAGRFTDTLFLPETGAGNSFATDFLTGTQLILSNSGPSYIGFAANQPSVAYAQASGNWFTNSVAADIAYRNTLGGMIWGNSTGDFSMSLRTDSLFLLHSPRILQLATAGTAPTTFGTVHMVTVDQRGKLSRQAIPSGGGGAWGSITGTLSSQTDLQTALDGKVDENGAITGATKTKITYDAKGLVTAGADLVAGDIPDISATYVPVAGATTITGGKIFSSTITLQANLTLPTGSLSQGAGHLYILGGTSTNGIRMFTGNSSVATLYANGDGTISLPNYTGAANRLLYLDASEVVQVSSITPASLVTAFSNLGSGVGVYSSMSSNTAQFKSFNNGAGLTLSTDVNTIEYGSKQYSLTTVTTDVGNVTTGEDDLMQYSIPAGQMATNGDYLEFTMTLYIAGNVNTKEINVYFGSSNILNIPALATSEDGTIEISGTIIRTGASTQKATVSWRGSTDHGQASAHFSQPNQTLSNIIVLKATGESTATDDIIQKIMTVKYFSN